VFGFALLFSLSLIARISHKVQLTRIMSGSSELQYEFGETFVDDVTA
jgi:hypothetical protein